MSIRPKKRARTMEQMAKDLEDAAKAVSPAPEEHPNAMPESEPRTAPEPSSEPPKEWKQYTIDVNFHVDVPPPVWVIRVMFKQKDGPTKKMYLRMPSTGGFLLTPSIRTATRVDSALWAETLAIGIRQVNPTFKVQISRLWTKTEREVEKTRREGPKRYTFGADAKIGAAFVQPKSPEKAPNK